MKKILLAFVFALLSAFTFAQERIAVFPFEDRNSVFNRDELDLFYCEFTNEFRNKTDDSRFTVIPRQEVEKLINMESAFQAIDSTVVFQPFTHTDLNLSGETIIFGINRGTDCGGELGINKQLP
jgi:hypothetical protein